MKLIDPKATRKDLTPPRRSAPDHGNLFEQQSVESSKTDAFHRSEVAVGVKGADDEAEFGHPSLSHFYGAVNSDAASPSFAPPPGGMRLSFGPHKNDMLQKMGPAAAKPKEEPLPLSTGLDYFVQTEKKRKISKEAELDFDNLNDRGLRVVSTGVKSALRGNFGELSRCEDVTVTYAEAARHATKECWFLIRGVYNWVVITLL